VITSLRFRPRYKISSAPIPSAVPIYKTTLTTTTNETTTTWLAQDIGTPHAQRVVILAVYGGGTSALTGTVAGISPTSTAHNTSRWVGLMSFAVPSGATADIVVDVPSSARKAVAVYVAYPASATMVSSDDDSAAGTTDVVASALTANAGGFLIYAGGQNAFLGTFSTTWSGADAVVEDVDAQLEAVASYTMGHINLTESISGNLTMAETASGTKHIFAATWL
jgi:hypothetical protein